MAKSTESIYANNCNPSTVPPRCDLANSINSDSGKARLIQCFPRHHIVKLDEGNFIQWQQHIKLIVEGYELIGFIEKTLPTPPRFVPSPEGQLVLNLEASLFHQQDKLLASWLLSMISGSLISCFTNAKNSCDVWNTANRLFAAMIGAKLSRINHELHLIKKSNLTIKEYLFKIQNTCTVNEASGHWISEAKKVEIVFAGLSLEYDVVLTLASFSSKPLPIQKLLDVLLEYESQQQRVVQETSYQVNLVEMNPPSVVIDLLHGGHSSACGRGRGFKACVQC